MTGSAAAQFILVIPYFFWYCHDGATDMINEVLTVSALNSRIKDLLEASFELLWVEGEVSNLRRPASGHVYFTLKDDRSQIRSVVFRSPFAPGAAFPKRAGPPLWRTPPRGKQPYPPRSSPAAAPDTPPPRRT